MVALIHEAILDLPRDRIVGIAIGAPGPLDPYTGVVIDCPNLPGFENFPLRDRIAIATGLPAIVENDANAAAVGEHRFGAGKGFAHMVYLTISTGIGGGIIANGRLYWGEKGFAGEVGHMTIEAHGPRCNCGNIGCLEALAAGPAIARNARAAIATGRDTRILEMTPERDPEQITAHIVTDAAIAGDALGVELLAQAGFHIGVGIVNLLHILNPGRVVIGGGVSFAGDLLFEPIRQTVAERAPLVFRQGVEIVPAALGDDAGLLGAAALAFAAAETHGL
jgi:glucokinase